MPAKELSQQQLSIITSAVTLIESGCTVVPTKKDGGKAPAVSWKDYQTNKPTKDDIARWFVEEQHTGIGIITGKASGNLEMIELEGRAVETGMDQDLESIAYAAGLEELWDRISSGWTEQSPSGGIHWFIRISDGIVPGNTKLAVDHDNKVLAETRGEGGFVVVAPSYGNVHETGYDWRILEGGPNTIASLTWEERCTFINLLKSLSHHKPTEKTEPKISVQPTGDRPGDQWAQSAEGTWEAILEPHGWRKIFTTQTGVTHWRRPGKNTGTSATTGYSETGNLYIFSTNAHPFEGETSYSKFAAHALLNFGGNYADAARDLAHKGYGTNQQASELKSLNQLTDTAPINTTTEPDEIDPDDSSWKPIDLTRYWFGLDDQTPTGLLHRIDGKGLLYPGKVHSIYGESESGKSWLAQIATAATLTNGGNAIYIDFEGDPKYLTKRLQLLGLTPNDTRNLRYLRPETARNITDPHWQNLLNQPAQLIVIDGVTESLTMFGGDTKDNDTITTWNRLFPRALAKATGAAVITIDHVPKDKETRGRFAIGGQAKLAAIDGAAYLVEPLEGLAPGKIGKLTIRITKDRPGSMRAIAGQWGKDRTQELAVLTMDSTHTPINYTFDVPLSKEEVAEFHRERIDQHLFDYIYTHPNCTKTDLLKSFSGDDNLKKERLRKLMDAGFIKDKGKGTRGSASILVTTDAGEREFSGQLRSIDEV